jgi:hypothetical protein
MEGIVIAAPVVEYSFVEQETEAPLSPLEFNMIEGGEGVLNFF